jgi:peptidoglycan/LPS O-acetylase OafA/YrhL
MRLDKLDLVRGVAALAVFIGHLRGFLFVEHSKLPHTNVLIDLFYTSTGFGHAAVMVFFTLSGFLIGGAVHDRFMARRWSFSDYAVRRMTRLWLVLIPALVFTLFMDSLGSWMCGGLGYDGCFYERNHQGPSLLQPAQHGGLLFLGNAFFLQTIIVPRYGTDGPLWSLANEFWYYVMFPLGFAAYQATMGRSLRLLAGGLLILVAFLLPFSLVMGGLIWLMGYGAFLVTRCRALRAWTRSNGIFLAAFACFLGILIWSRFRTVPYADYIVGMLFACMLPKLATDVPTEHWWRRIARYLGEMSYSLYVFHFPCMAFLAFGVFRGRQWYPNLAGFLVYFIVAILVFGVARLAWWLFERRTDEVRQKIKCLPWFQSTAL